MHVRARSEAARPAEPLPPAGPLSPPGSNPPLPSPDPHSPHQSSSSPRAAPITRALHVHEVGVGALHQALLLVLPLLLFRGRVQEVLRELRGADRHGQGGGGPGRQRQQRQQQPAPPGVPALGPPSSGRPARRSPSPAAAPLAGSALPVPPRSPPASRPTRPGAGSRRYLQGPPRLSAPRRRHLAFQTGCTFQGVNSDL